MNVIEAIDAWIDERIDDMSDDELGDILEILDAIAPSEYGDFDIDDVYDEDIEAMLDLVAPELEPMAETILTSAIYGAESDSNDGDASDGDEFQDERDQDARAELDGDTGGQDGAARSSRYDHEDHYGDADDTDDGDAAALDNNDDAGYNDRYDDGDVDNDELDDDQALQDQDDAGYNDRYDDEDSDDADDRYDEEDADDRYDDEDADDRYDEEDSDDAIYDDEDADDATSDDDRNDAGGDLDHDADEDKKPDQDDELEVDELETDAASDDLDVAYLEADDLDVDELEHDESDLLVENLDGLRDESEPQRSATRASSLVASPIRLREFDALGPSFLSNAPETPTSKVSAFARYGVMAFFALALAAFLFGTLQLFGSLSDEAEEPEAAPAATATEATAEQTPETSEPTATVEAATAAPGAPTATPTPEPPPPARIAIRLVNGDVMLATLSDEGEPANVVSIYEGSSDNLSPATDVSWFIDRIGVVDADGNVLTVDPSAPGARPKTIYQASDELDEVVELVATREDAAVRTQNGSVVAISRTSRARTNNIDVLWDATEEDSPATDISAINDVVVFTLANGNAKLANLTQGDEPVDIWVADEQPPAFNVAASSKSILLGVGQGAVARLPLGSSDGPPVTSAWDPFEDDEIPAIGYSAAGNRTAVVLANGAIVLADDTRTGPRIWDPEETELRALTLSATEASVIVLLETGSVVRIPVDPSELIESVWDITDESLTPANQVAAELVSE